MIIHIVRENERISDIIKSYNISFDELKTNNLHITDFNHLRAGTKLRIPSINQETMQILNETEPLVSNYYKPNFEEDEKEIKKPEVEKKVDQQDKQIIRNRGFNLFNSRPLSNPFKNQIYPHFIKKKKTDI